jgi:membrane protein
MRVRLRVGWDLVKQTFREWNEDKATHLAAALAYYTVFSLAPILIIVIAIAGFFFGREAVQGQVMNQMNDLIGEKSAATIQMAIQSAYKPTSGIIATIIGIVMLLFGASGVFSQLQDSLNTIWGVEPKPGRSWWIIVKERFASFTAILGIGFLLLVSLIVSAAISAMGKYLGSVLPLSEALLQWINFFVSFGVISALFAMIFKILPDVKISWKDVLVGSLMTALLFDIGKFLIGFYLGKSSAASAYGAAGTILVVLLWAYYSSLILIFGAEFTQVYANRFGKGVVPTENAQFVKEQTMDHSDPSFGAHGKMAH